MICPQRDSFQLFWQHLKKEDAMLSSLCLRLEIFFFFFSHCVATQPPRHIWISKFSLPKESFPSDFHKKSSRNVFFYIYIYIYYYSPNWIPRDIVCQCQFRVSLLTYGALKPEKAIQTDPVPGKEIFEISRPYCSDAESSHISPNIWFTAQQLHCERINSYQICALFQLRDSFHHVILVINKL